MYIRPTECVLGLQSAFFQYFVDCILVQLNNFSCDGQMGTVHSQLVDFLYLVLHKLR